MKATLTLWPTSMLEHEYAVRLLAAAVLAGLIGLEREMKGRAAGLRTHILVSLGSALVMLTSIYISEMYRGVAEVDPSRIAAQVVSGIGFLGAGAIIRSQASVSGLTTAATLWIASAIGLACGVGFYHGAFFVTALVLIGLIFFSRLEARIFGEKKHPRP